MQVRTEPTLLEYAAEHRADPFWDDLHRSLLAVVSRITCGICGKRTYDDAGRKVVELNEGGHCSDCAARANDTTAQPQTVTPNGACEMCGLPSWAITTSGVRITLRVAAENKFRRDRKRTVWCCSKSCAIQSFAISRMGPTTYKWPVTLAEFTAIHREEIERAIQTQAECTDIPSKTLSAAPADGPGLNEQGVLAPPYGEGISERSQADSGRKGRPRKWASDAERMRAQRAAKREAYVG